MHIRFSRALTLFLILLIGGGAPAAAEVFCDANGRDPRVEMPATTALPWGAVGYINNGCTATLISQSHLLTADHCVTSVDNRSWQGDL